MTPTSRSSLSLSLFVIHGNQSLRSVLVPSLGHFLHLNRCLHPKTPFLCQAAYFSQLTLDRGKDPVHQGAALAAHVAVDVPILPEVGLVAAAKTIVGATVDLDLP